MIYISGSQPGCRGTLGCREEVLGVPPNVLDFLLFGSITYETNEYLASRVQQSSSLPM